MENNQLASTKGLENLTKIRSLNLGKNQLTSIEYLTSLPLLSWINLEDNLFTDTKGLGQLANLTSINLTKNKLVSIDASIGGLTQLKDLTLYANAIPKSEIKKLKWLLPNTKIHF